jgi:DNA (cytosine-5)-methyltransferase 1
MPPTTENSKTNAGERVPVATDIFSGVGGLTHGLIRAGIQVAAGVDVDESCRYAYEHNNAPAQFICRDVSQLTADELIAFYPENSLRILVGCAPCRPFSTYTRSKEQHEDYELLSSFRDLIEGVVPTVVSMENVPQLRKYPIYEDFLQTLNRHDYFVWQEPVYCPSYGIPQRRTRLVLLASKLGPIELIPPTHDENAPTTVRDAIGHLPPLEAGEVSPDDPLHRCHNLSSLNLRRIRATSEGGGWSSWPDELKLKCHKKPSGETYGSVYGRMWWNQPASTMTTQCCGLGNGRFGHPEQDRAISLREAALFQSFPFDYEFFPKDSFPGIDSLERHIGNAVPVKLGEVVGLSISRHLETYRERQRENPTQV